MLDGCFFVLLRVCFNAFDVCLAETDVIASMREGNVAEARDYLKRLLGTDSVAANPLVRYQMEKAVRLTDLLLELKEDPARKWDEKVSKLSAEEWIELATDSCTYQFFAAGVRFFE